MSEDRDRPRSTTFTTYYDERWTVGWDPTLETYFATVDRPDPTPDQQRQLQAWEDYYNSDDCLGDGLPYGDHVEELRVARRVDHIAGTHPRDVNTADDLLARFEPHVQLSDHIRDRWLPVVNATKDGPGRRPRAAIGAPDVRRPEPSNRDATTDAATANFRYRPRHARDFGTPAALASADYPRRLSTALASSSAARHTTPDARHMLDQADTGVSRRLRH